MTVKRIQYPDLVELGKPSRSFQQDDHCIQPSQWKFLRWVCRKRYRHKRKIRIRLHEEESER